MSRVVNVSETLSRNLGTYTLVSGSFNGQGATYFQGLVGKGVTASTTTSNYYSSSNGTITVFTYDMSFTGIPEGAVITRVYCQVNGHAESTSNSSEYMCVRLVSDNTNLTDELNFKSVGTSNSTQTIECTTMPTVSQLANMKLRCRLGYYGGAINGATAYVEYSISTTAYTVTATSTYTGATVEPSNQEIYHGDSGSVSVYVDDLSSIEVLDNGVDVTDSLQYVPSQPGVQTFTGIPVSFDNENSVYNRTAGDNGNGIYSTNYIENGFTNATSTTRAAFYTVQGSNAQTYVYYNFDCSLIPLNATIQSVSCLFKGGTQGSSYYSSYVAQLCVGTTAIGNAVSVTGSNTAATTVTLSSNSTLTRSDLNNIKVKFQVTRGSSNTTTDSTFSFYGATLTVQYTLPQEPYYIYNLTNVTADHTIVVNESIYIPPEEEPDKTYYSVTISSINAITEPGRGTYRVESGTSEVITIYPSDPQITLVTDNGVDITSQLVQHGSAISDPTIATAPGASYGFTYLSSTGYYVSQNEGVASSAAVARVSFDLPVRCLVTIQYINYAEATYDYGIFGYVDTALNTGSTADSNAYKVCSTSNDNTSMPQTLTYEIDSGSHYIDIKFRKDTYTDSNNDTLQFKILSIEPLEANNYYTYSLSNVNSDHSLIFIFGDVTYYFVNSSVNGDGRIYPDGQMVQLPGDTYKLTIVPTESGNTVSITDNNVDVTSSLVQKTETLEKSGQTITVVNYIYTLANIQATHNINVVCVAQESNIIYTRQGGSWSKNTNIYVKENGNWLQQEISIDIFDGNRIYLNNL